MIKNLVHLFYPDLCVACGMEVAPEGSPICLRCEVDLPLALMPTGGQFVERVFWGRLPLTAAWAWLRFRKDNRARELMHALKYGGNPKLVRAVGRRFGRDLERLPDVQLPEVLVPIPLHPKKLRQRGYNQAEMIALGMSDVLQIPIEPRMLVRVVHRSSLTRLSRVDRYEQIRTGYGVRPASQHLRSHVCLVDDVITTGATIEVCGSLLLETGVPYLSVASLAYAEKMF
jgi:ComF family protein